MNPVKFESMMSLSGKPLALAALCGCLAFVLPTVTAAAADAARIVFQNGRSIPITAVSVQGDQIVVQQATDGYNSGQKFSLASASHIYGDKPVETDRAIALLLSDKPADALELLEPVIASQQVTASIPGNFWLEAARAALVAYAMTGDSDKVASLGKDISDATPQQGADPFNSLAKALMLPKSTPDSELATAFQDLTTDNLPAAVCAYASFFRANALKNAKKNDEALEAYLIVPCLFPSGGRILNAAAELNAAEYLTEQGRREESLALLNSSAREATGTLLGAEANKRLESLK
jgi:tetratricopeptide (TPR) repeat protein